MPVLSQSVRSSLIPILLAVFLLSCIAVTINQTNQEEFNLQQIGVESLVERGTFALEGSVVPQLQPRGDVFVFNGHQYAIKQPGQFVAGAFVYQMLYLFGLTYQRNYVLTAALVTLFSSGIAVATIGVVLFQMGKKLLRDTGAALVIAVLGSCGTMLLPYAGVSHHDTLATALVFVAFFLTQFAAGSSQKSARFFVAGLLSSLTLFFSMLPAALVATLVLWVLWQTTTTRRVFFALGVGVGLLPLVFYNQTLFGSWIAFPNAASGASDTFPFFSIANTLDKLRFYLLSPATSLWVFSPLLLLGVVGWFKFGTKRRSVGVVAATLTVAHLAYITSIATVGHAQYGPRYLLPVIPFFMVGILGLIRWAEKKKSWISFLTWGLVVVFGVLGVLAQGLGALIGVMYNEISVYPVPLYWQQFQQWERIELPLLTVGTMCFVVSAAALVAIALFGQRPDTKNPS